jgi:hypothetical protein
MNGYIDYFAVEEVSKKLPDPNKYPSDVYCLPVFKDIDYLVLEGTEVPIREEHFIKVFFHKRRLLDFSGYCWVNKEFGIVVYSK